MRNVIRGTDPLNRPGTHPRVVVKWAQLDQAAALLGAETDRARAFLFDFDLKTISNMRKGCAVRDRSVAKILAVLRAHEVEMADVGLGIGFDDFFEVVEEAA